jgi:serine/threonine-protein kinase
MEQLLKKCLAKSPMDRFQSMDEVLQAMQEFTSPAFATPGFGTQGKEKAAPVRARPPGPVRSAALKPARTSYYKPALLFLLAVGVGSGVTWLLRPRAVNAPVVLNEVGEGKQVYFRIDSVPEGATVTVAGELLGTTPLEFELPAEADGRTSADITLALEGYSGVTVTAGGSGPAIEVIQTLQELPEARIVRVPVRSAKSVRKRVQLSAAQKKKISTARSAPKAPPPTSSARLSDSKDDDDARPDDGLKRPPK